ncbi:MAG: hypothetical protein FWG19_03515, partial [Methanomassiliicoccaceae archaeon]|nr:hypothetical protein [Methanomassiliicoccaceae archaeon]
LWGIDIVDTDVNPNADVGAIVKAAELIDAAGLETKGDLPVGDNIRNRINYEFMREAGLPAAEFVLKEKDERWGIIPP